MEDVRQRKRHDSVPSKSCREVTANDDEVEDQQDGLILCIPAAQTTTRRVLVAIAGRESSRGEALFLRKEPQAE
jgi:hypothetical protein